MKKNRFWPCAAIVAIVLFGGGLYLFLQDKQYKSTRLMAPQSGSQTRPSVSEASREPGATKERLPVKVTPARKSNLEVTLPVFGAVTYVDKCDASGEETGNLIKDLPVSIGEMVKPGQAVAVIDTDILKEELKARRANLNQIKALLDLAYWKYEAQRKVHASGGASLQELEEAGANYQARRAEVAKIQAEIDLLETKIRKAVVRSPIQGIVGKKNYFPGEKVPTPSEKGIVTIFRIDQVYVEAEISEKDLTKLRPGLEAAIYLDAYPGTRFMGAVEQLEPLLKERNSSVIRENGKN